jgi:hypothetical protein
MQNKMRLTSTTPGTKHTTATATAAGGGKDAGDGRDSNSMRMTSDNHSPSIVSNSNNGNSDPNSGGPYAVSDSNDKGEEYHLTDIAFTPEPYFSIHIYFLFFCICMHVCLFVDV